MLFRSGAKDLTGAAITQLTGAGSAQIEFRANDLDNANDFTHVRISSTTVGAGAIIAGVLLATCPTNAPLAAGSKIDETVSV